MLFSNCPDDLSGLVWILWLASFATRGEECQHSKLPLPCVLTVKFRPNSDLRPAIFQPKGS